MNLKFLLHLSLGVTLMSLPFVSFSQTDCDNDLIPPIALCVEEIDVLLTDGVASLDVSEVDNGSTDNCSIFSMSLTQSDFTCEELPINYDQFLSFSTNIIPVEIYAADGYKGFTGSNGIQTVVEGFSSDKVEFYLESSAGLIPGTNCFEVKVNDFTNVLSMQYAFEFDPEYLSFVDINNVSLSLFTQSNFSTEDSTITISWNSLNPVMGESFIDGTTLFSLCFEQLDNDPLVTTLYISDDAGNTAACNTLVNLIGENVAPVIECTDITVELPASGEFVIDPLSVLESVDVACGDYQLVVNNELVDCDDYFLTEKHAPYFLSGNLSPEAINTSGFIDFEGNSYFENVVSETPSEDKVSFDVKQFSEDDQFVCFDLEVADFKNIVGFQFTLAYESEILKLSNIEGIEIPSFTDVYYNSPTPGQINFSWSSTDVINGLSISDGGTAIRICFEKSMETNMNNQLTLITQQGLSATCDFSVEVLDLIAPELFLEDVVISLDEYGTVTLSKENFIGLVEDNCGVASITTDKVSFDCSDIVSYPEVDIDIVDLPASIEFININSELVSVIDILSGDLITEGNADEEIGINIVQSAGDQPYQFCYDFLVEDFNEMLGMQFSLNYDANGLNYTGLASSDLPFFSNQNINLASPGELIVSWTSIDIDNGVSVPVGFNMFSICFDYLGSIGQEVELTAVDYSGNEYTGTAYAVVIDDLAPEILCDSTASILLDQDGLALLLPEDYTVSAVDNCSEVNLSLEKTMFTCEDLGVNPIEITASDEYSNTSTCVLEVNVMSNIAPSLTCRGIMADVFIDGQFELSVDDLLIEASDDCGIVDFSMSQSVWECQSLIGTELDIITGVNEDFLVEFADVDAQPVETEFVLNCGSESFGEGNTTVSLEVIPSEVSIEDNFVCYDFNVSNFTNMLTMQFSMDFNSANATFIGAVHPILDENNSDLTVFSDEENVSLLWADNDFINGLTVEDGTALVTMCFETVLDFSSRVVELTATDASGNSKSCEVMLSVCDKVSPVASCQDLMVSLDSDNQLTLTADMLDNSSSDDCCLADLAVLRVDPVCDGVTEFSSSVQLCEEDLGEEILVLLRVEDCSGNSSICESVVEVDDVSSSNEMASDNLEFNVYPNPFNDKLNLSFELDRQESLLIEIFDANGSLITSQRNTFSKGQVDLQFSEFSTSGIYFIRIQGENILLHQKVTRI